MNISIANCNNIEHGTVAIEENRLNIKYAINGTGKSTIAKAIEYAAHHDEDGLKRLTPYSHIEQPMIPSFLVLRDFLIILTLLYLTRNMSISMFLWKMSW